MRTSLLLLACGLAWGQPALSPPQIGWTQDGTASLRPLYGVAGNFLWGDPISANVNSVAFSGQSGLVKTDDALIVLDRQGRCVSSTDAAPGSALLAFARDGSPALAFSSGNLLSWSAGGWQPVAFDPGAVQGNIQSVFWADPSHAGLIVQRDTGLWDVRIDFATGAIDAQTFLPGLTGPALRLASGKLIAGDLDGAVIQRIDGTVVHLAAPLPARFALAQMGEAWVELSDLSSTAQFAIRTIAGREAIFQLPGVGQ